ncbi:hypothetical protein BDU57DRAFT_549510 [Ampelomyces quisqualis]|uniref:Uncharacterized protein n=1 Tax=Ampelomyces quisqualis TaxID=50730 RepID=A0A6A5QHL9_AMPQU|nr:hypothetical protein BDU57DRAFT_549510 [Ampelomyces quisqualis]
MAPQASPVQKLRADSIDEEDILQRARAREMLTAVEMLALDRVDFNGGSVSASKIGKLKAPPSSPSSEYSEQNDFPVDLAQETQQHRAQHLRNQSLHVTWAANDIERMAKEISDETIADVHLSLLGYWICERTAHYEMAKRFIRELSLDQGYNVNRIRNESLRNLLISTKGVRPKEAIDKLILLPLAMREQRERTMQGINPKSPVSSPIRNYPPDTPDRPEPLSVRSRHTGRSFATPTNAHRSISAPIANTAKLYTTPVDRNSTIYENTISHPLLAKTAGSNRASNGLADADDVFGIVEDGDARRSNTLTAMHMSNEGTNTPQASSARRSGAHPSHAHHNDSQYHDAFDTMHDYATSATTSILESASTADSNQHQSTRYAYTMPYPIDNTVDNYRGTAHLRTADLVRRAASMGCRPNRRAGQLHRPLPLRSYESEAHLHPTIGARGASTHARTLSAGNLIRSNRPAALGVERAQDNSNQPGLDRPRDSSTPGESESLFEPTQSSVATTLLNFPVPPMSNPVGLLPMHVSRATTARSSISSTNSAPPVGSLAAAIQSISYSANMVRNILHDTRARGEQLPSINWTNMSPFERSWRESNEELLVGIYGRVDTWLSTADVAFVDCVGTELAATGSHLVWELFREDEMF